MFSTLEICSLDMVLRLLHLFVFYPTKNINIMVIVIQLFILSCFDQHVIVKETVVGLIKRSILLS